ncbi:MAG: hypothetical protein WA642_05300 [Steroidobacteraceae bacterium]
MRTAIILVPILPGLALIGLTAALAAIVVAALSLVYFYMELLGFPHLSTAWISNVVWAVFVVQMVRLIATGK